MSNQGTVVVQDSHTGAEHRLPITGVSFKNGALLVEARAKMRTSGSINDGDIVTIYDPDRRMVTRYWLTMQSAGPQFVEREDLLLLLPIGMGGPGGMAFADLTFDLGAELEAP
ncbi:hypothetical protein ABTX71_12910 [Streptomyces parvulus]|uniref:hypothetical protein n=1 Tax=Streptomyces parvulus TaxID=146923 RepID=UPI003321C7C1